METVFHQDAIIWLLVKLLQLMEANSNINKILLSHRQTTCTLACKFLLALKTKQLKILFIIIIIIIFTLLIVSLPAVSSCYNWVIWHIFLNSAWDADSTSGANLCLQIWELRVYVKIWLLTLFLSKKTNLPSNRHECKFRKASLPHILSWRMSLWAWFGPWGTVFYRSAVTYYHLCTPCDDRNNQAVSCQAIFTTAGPHLLITSRNQVLTDGPMHIDRPALPRSK